MRKRSSRPISRIDWSGLRHLAEEAPRWVAGALVLRVPTGEVLGQSGEELVPGQLDPCQDAFEALLRSL